MWQDLGDPGNEDRVPAQASLQHSIPSSGEGICTAGMSHSFKINTRTRNVREALAGLCVRPVRGDRVWHVSLPVTSVPCGPSNVSSAIPSPRAAGLGSRVCDRGHGDGPHQHCQSAHTVSPSRGSGDSSGLGSHSAQGKEVLAPVCVVPPIPSAHVLRESCSQAPNCHVSFVREVFWECQEMHPRTTAACSGNAAQGDGSSLTLA